MTLFSQKFCFILIGNTGTIDQNITWKNCHLTPCHDFIKDPKTLKHNQITIFFTRVFIGRYTLHEKSTKSSPKILSLAKYWVTKSIFSPAVSQKPKTEVVFFLSALTLN